jgi:hypothetical protein
MTRSDGYGLGAALVGHAVLFLALTLTIAHRTPPTKAVEDVMDVQLVDTVGLRSAVPVPATEAPREATAPELGPMQDAAVVPPPMPTPAPERPAIPQPTPAPPAAARPTPKKLSSDLLRDLNAAAKAERATGPKIGPDFLKGVLGKAAGKGTTARAAISGPAVQGLAAAIKRQVQPCYDLGSLSGTPAMQIVTVLQLRFNPDGSVAGTPQVVEQPGVNAGNSRYAAQMVDVSRRAVLKCSPLKLPAELYEGGWENITMGFIPGQMQ